MSKSRFVKVLAKRLLRARNQFFLDIQDAWYDSWANIGNSTYIARGAFCRGHAHYIYGPTVRRACHKALLRPM